MADDTATSMERKDSYLSIGVIPHDTPDDRKRLEGALKFWIDQMNLQKWPRALQWMTNFSFLCGNHYPDFYFTGETISFTGTTFDGPGSDLRSRGAAANAVPKTADNRLIRPHESNVSLFTQELPQPRVSPNSDRAMDREAAKLAEVVLDVLWEDLDMLALQRQFAGYLSYCGTAAMEPTFRETDTVLSVPKTRTVRRPDDYEDEGSVETEEETGESEAIFEEDLRCDVWSGFEIQPDPAATDRDDSLTWIYRHSYQDIGWIQENFDRDEEGYYPEVLEHVGGEVATNTPLYWWERLKDILDTPQFSYGLTGYPYTGSGGNAPNQTILYVFDVKPNRHYPRGRTLIMAGTKLIYAGDARAWHERYPERWHPYSFARYWSAQGRFWGIPLMTGLVPLQRRINAIDSLVQLNREFMAIGQWLVPKTAKVPNDHLSGIPGQNIPYRVSPTGAKPEKVQHEPLPGELVNEKRELIAAIEELSGTSRILASSGQSNLRAGVMLDFMRNDQNRSRSAMLQGYERCMEQTSKNMLIEISISLGSDMPAFTRRLAASAREHGLHALESFKGADLRDNVQVRLDMASALLRSPEAKQGRAAELLTGMGENLSEAQRAKLLIEAGFENLDIDRTPHYEAASKQVSRILEGNLQFAFDLRGVANAEVFAQVFQQAILEDSFIEAETEIQKALIGQFQMYSAEVQRQQEMAIQRQIAMVAAMNEAGAGGSGGKSGDRAAA